MRYEEIPSEDEALGQRIIGAAIEVHRNLGPGFLESVYETALCHELALLKIPVQQQLSIQIPYKGIHISGQRLDLLVSERVIVELKCIDDFAPIHQAQLLSYLKSTGLRLGFLINFKTRLLKDGGIKRVVL